MNSETIIKITELAKQPEYTPGMVARVLGIDYTLFLEEGPAKDAFDSGKLQARLELNRKVAKLSNQGSGPSQTLLAKMLRQNEIDTLREYYG